ncbi:hypothetical protein U5903_04150 [Cereibacter johrii]|uniref:hypothetical protein n=1 Tax=Cereibacter johrii TaxID=445629 RepID=UPI002B25B228|nr:hypothetical protein [Cereibacter johrii]MEA5159960.1 hypothetical protein [Cereibacter johrii]
MHMQHDLFSWSASPAALVIPASRPATVTVQQLPAIAQKPAVYIPPKTESGEIFGQIVRDLDFLIERFRRLGPSGKALGHSDALEATAEELAELLLSVGATASLTSYRLPGGPWQLDCVKQDSKQATKLLGYMDDMRAELLMHEASTMRALRSAKVRTWLKRSLALCCLSFDSVTYGHRRDFLAFAGLAADTQDPVGDAQLECEQHELNDTIPLFNI